MDTTTFPALDSIGVHYYRGRDDCVFVRADELHEALMRLHPDMVGTFTALATASKTPRHGDGWFAYDADRVVAAMLAQVGGLKCEVSK